MQYLSVLNGLLILIGGGTPIMCKKPLSVGAASTLALLLSAPVVAQTESEDVPVFIEEIITTATKREQTLQDTPVAVSVVAAEELQRAQVRDVKDLQFMVPSLRITQLQTSGNTNFVIRGFGNGANNAGIEPSVGVFIDGVYRSRSSAALADFPDLERIEVLRGPQSTLFGKNASAGVISVTTAKPDLNAFGGSASLTVGNDSHYLARANVTGPLSDSVAFSLSGSVNQRDGYYKNLTNGDELNEWDRWNLRGQLLFLPSDNLEIRLIADAEEIDEACCGVANLQDGPTGAAVRALGGNLVPNAPFAYEGFYDFTPTNKLENAGISAQIDYDWSEVTFTSITSLRTFDRFEDADVDFTSARLVSTNQSETEIETFTQEFRLTSTGGGSFDWLVGAFFFDESVDIADQILYDDQFRPYGDFLATAASGGIPFVDPSPLSTLEAGLMLPPGTFFAPGQGISGTAGQDDQTFNLFAQVDFDIGDRTTITLGANYTEVEKDAFVDLASTDVFSGVDLVQVGFAQAFGAITMLPPTPDNIAANPAAAAQAQALASDPATNPLLGLRPFQFLPPFVAFPNAVEPGQSKDDDVTWTARIAFDLTDSVNVYASAGTGFKATSWNLSRDSRPFPSDIPALAGAGLTVPNLASGTRFADPEESTVYELGLKAQTSQFAINVALFDQEIENFQSNIFRGTGFSLANAGKQSTTGLEVDMTWYATDSFQWRFAGTFLDPEYDSFVEGNGVNGPEDLSGTQPPGIHEVSISTSGLYSFELGAASGFVRVEYVYDDEVQVIENVPADVASREVSTINASIGLEWDNGFEALLWGRNINDDEYLQSAFPSVAQAGSYSG